MITLSLDEHFVIETKEVMDIPRSLCPTIVFNKPIALSIARALIVIAIFFLAPIISLGQENGTNDVPAELKVEEVVAGLTTANSIAIQPGTDQLFISDGGAGRIVSVVDGKLKIILNGIPTIKFGSETNSSEVGSTGILFQNQSNLIVGLNANGKEVKRSLLTINTSNAKEAPLEFAKLSENLDKNEKTNSDDPTKEASNAFNERLSFARPFAKTSNGIFVCNQFTENRLVRFNLKNDQASNPFMLQTKLTDVNSITMVPLEKNEPANSFRILAVASQDKTSGGSKIIFVDEFDGKNVGEFSSGLKSVTSIRYSPHRKQLFALGSNGKATGLFKLVDKSKVDSEAECEAKLVLELDPFLAMEFDSKGNLMLLDSDRVCQIKNLDPAPAAASESNPENKKQTTENSETVAEPEAKNESSDEDKSQSNN